MRPIFYLSSPRCQFGFAEEFVRKLPIVVFPEKQPGKERKQPGKERKWHMSNIHPFSPTVSFFLVIFLLKWAQAKCCRRNHYGTRINQFIN